MGGMQAVTMIILHAHNIIRFSMNSLFIRFSVTSLFVLIELLEAVKIQDHQFIDHSQTQHAKTC